MGQYIPFDESELRNLNNFFCHFPIGTNPYPTHIPEGFYRSIGNDDMFRNRTYRDSSGESGLSERELKDYFADRSEKRLDQTQEQFYAEVDKVVQELEMDMVLIQKTINVYIHDREYEDKNPRELIKVLDKFLAPIYVALRKKGYNSQDLVG